jgi:hypothetical protein
MLAVSYYFYIAKAIEAKVIYGLSRYNKPLAEQGVIGVWKAHN